MNPFPLLLLVALLATGQAHAAPKPCTLSTKAAPAVAAARFEVCELRAQVRAQQALTKATKDAATLAKLDAQAFALRARLAASTAPTSKE